MQLHEIEYRLKSDDQLCFVRIPKTASTTLLSLLNAKFSSEEICPILEGEIFNASPEELAKYRFFGAHFDYDIHTLLGKQPVYLTLLRHPVARAISFYKHRKSDDSSDAFAQFLKAETAKGLKAFVSSTDPNIRIRISNLATRKIALGLGKRHSAPFEVDARESQFSDQELLSLAKAHLEEFAFIGLTELFQPSLFLLAYTFGWAPVTQYQNRRVNTEKLSRDTIDADTEEAILQANSLDMQLYQYGQQLFISRFTQMLQKLQEKYGKTLEFSIDSSACSEQQFQLVTEDSRFQKSLFSLLETHYKHRYAELNLPPVSSIYFNTLKAIPGTGWQRRKWIGPGTEATLDFPLATDATLILRISISNTAAPDILNSFQLQVNYHPVPLKPLVKRERAGIFEARVSPSILDSALPFTRLTFTVNRTAPMPKLLNDGTSDQLLVSVAIHQIQIFAEHSESIPHLEKYMVFPHRDPSWIETVEFIQSHLQPGERLAAPGEFVEPFPQPFHLSSDPFRHLPTLSWVIVHKGFVSDIDRDSLTWTIDRMKPVLANPVFIVFSNCQDLQPLKPGNPHLSAFLSVWRS